MRPLAIPAAAAALAVLAAAGCGSGTPKPAAATRPTSLPPAAPPASATSAAASAAPAAQAPPAPGPDLTGFGATMAQWNAAHVLDTTVPAGGAYLPRIGGDGTDTWQVVMAPGGRVDSYTLNVAPVSLAGAVARARQELPADARLLWVSQFSTCSQAQFQSATLRAVLGDGQVNVEFDNSDTSQAAPITEELFSTNDALTPAQAPGC